MASQVKAYIMKRPSMMIGVLALIGLIVVVMGLLIGFHDDTTQYTELVSPIVVTFLGLFVVSRQIDDVRDKTKGTADRVENIESNTNGKLDKRFNELHDAINELKDRKGDIR